MRFLLVEDDAGLSRSLLRGLCEHAYVVDIVTEGDAALYQASVNQYDAIILDINIPNIDGLEVCRTLRRRGDPVRILMLTARGSIEDRVEGLDSGADDYLPKPFEFEELLARLRALLRRRGEQLEPPVFSLGDLHIDFAAQRVVRAGMPIVLTTKEFVLLSFLARNAGKVVARAAITEHVWDDNHDPATNAVEVYINRLRRKIDLPGLSPLIHTRRGSGYYLHSTSADLPADR